MTLTWHFDVDWDGDGQLEANEADRMIGLTLTRGRPRLYRRSSGDRPGRYERMRVGRAVIDLDNYDQRYSAWNASSPLYTDIQPRRYARIRVNDGSTTYTLMTGFISEPTIESRDRASVVMEDGWAWLEGREAELPVQTDVPTGTAILDLLEEVSWPEQSWMLGMAGLGETTYLSAATPPGWSFGKSLDTGLDVIPAWWAEGKVDRQIFDLVESEHGFCYIDADGQFVFLDRDTLYKSTPVATITQSQLLTDLEIGQPSDVVWNRIIVVCKPWTHASSPAKIWQMGSATYVRAGESFTFRATFDNPADGIVTPVQVTDFEANESSDGTGEDLTSHFTASVSAGALSADITMTNNGTVPGYVTSLQLRGQAYTQDVFEVLAQDQTSIDAYGPHTLKMETDWIQDTLVAYDMATWLLSANAYYRAAPRVMLERRDAEQFGYDLGTHITLDLDWYGLEDDYRIGYIRTRWLDNTGQRVQTEWRLEPMDTQNYWRLGVRGRSELSEPWMITSVFVDSVTLLGY